MRKGETKPPKSFTEATLLSAMEHASRFVDDKDLKEALDDDESHSGGIGTPATRAEVIEKLIQSEYVKLKGKQLRSILTGLRLYPRSSGTWSTRQGWNKNYRRSNVANGLR